MTCYAMAIVFSQSLFSVAEKTDKLTVWQFDIWVDILESVTVLANSIRSNFGNKFSSKIVHELDGRHWNWDYC